jgi:hypothetical protein
MGLSLRSRLIAWVSRREVCPRWPLACFQEFPTCFGLRITGFCFCPSPAKLQNATFRQLGLFSSSDKATLLGPLAKSNLNHWTTNFEVEVTLRPTVSWPIRLSVLPLLEQVTRCYVYLSDNYFLYFSCRAQSSSY